MGAVNGGMGGNTMRKNLYDVYENNIKIREKMTCTDISELTGIKNSAIFAAMDRGGICNKHGNKYSFKLAGVCGTAQETRDRTVVTNIKPKLNDYRTMTDGMIKQWENMNEAAEMIRSGKGKIVRIHGAKQVVRC